MSRNVSIFSVVVVMTVTLMATVAAAIATPNKGGSALENGQGNGLEKVAICHNGHTITVGTPGAAAHLAHHDVDTEGPCVGEGTTPEPPDGTTPELTTVATASVTLGQPISDTATLSGGDNPTGTITFNVYGPDDADCSGEPAFTSVVDVNGNGDYSSDPTPSDPSDDFVPSAAGTYRWTAEYSGDDNNEGVLSECNAANEQSVVNEASTTTPELTTQATVSATLGQPISDTATLSGATSDATGTISFSAYGPFDPTTDPTTDACDEANLVYESDPVDIGSPNENGDYVVSSDDPAVTTDDFAPSEVGRYQWVASYSGDANNGAVSSECNAANEQSVVNGTTSTVAMEQNLTLALHHKRQELRETKAKLQADETPQEDKGALRERRVQLREELNRLKSETSDTGE